MTWCAVPDFDDTGKVTAQVSLLPEGAEPRQRALGTTDVATARRICGFLREMRDRLGVAGRAGDADEGVVVAQPRAERRTDPGGPPIPVGGWKNDVVAVIAGTLVYLALGFVFHLLST